MVDPCPRCKGDPGYSEGYYLIEVGITGDQALTGNEEHLVWQNCRACQGTGKIEDAMRRKLQGEW